MLVYEVCRERIGSAALDTRLSEGWEPFGLAQSGQVWMVALRRAHELRPIEARIKNGILASTTEEDEDQ